MGKKSKKGMPRAGGRSKTPAARNNATRNISISSASSFQKPSVQAPEATPEIVSQPMCPTSAIELDKQTLNEAKEAPLMSVVLEEPEPEIEPEPRTLIQINTSKESEVVAAPKPKTVSAPVVPVVDPPVPKNERPEQVDTHEEVALSVIAAQMSTQKQPVVVTKGLSLNEPSTTKAKESQKGCDCSGCVFL